MCAQRRRRTPPAVPNTVPRIPSSSTSGPMYLRRSKLMRQAESFQERGKPRKTPEKCRFVKSWAISAYMYAVDRPIFQKLAFSRGFAAFSARFASKHTDLLRLRYLGPETVGKWCPGPDTTAHH